MKYKLIASAPTHEMMLKMLKEKYFYSDDIEFKGTLDLFSVHNSKGKINGYRVVRKSGRVRLEMELPQ